MGGRVSWEDAYTPCKKAIVPLYGEKKKVKYSYCNDCQFSFERKSRRKDCPKCGSYNISFMGGSFVPVKGMYWNPSER